MAVKIIECDQRSIEWARLHVGKITASEFKNLVTPEMKPREGEMPKTYLSRKLAEVFRGEPMCNLSPAFASSVQMEQGTLLEEEVIPWYSLKFNVPVKTVGFCETDDGLAGCSPDGLIGEDGGLEIKAPEPHTHCAYLLEGGIPKEYRPQVEFSLFVTGRPWWRFVSYRRRFPALVVEHKRNEETMEVIRCVVNAFHAKLSTAVAKLKTLK